MEDHEHTGWHTRSCWYKDGCDGCCKCNDCAEINKKIKELVALYQSKNSVTKHGVINLTKNLYKVACDSSRIKTRDEKISAACEIFKLSVGHFLEDMKPEEVAHPKFEKIYKETFDKHMQEVSDYIHAKIRLMKDGAHK